MANERKLRNGSNTNANGCTHASVSANNSPDDAVIVEIVFVASVTVEMSNMERGLLDLVVAIDDAGDTKAEAMFVVKTIKQARKRLEIVFILYIVVNLIVARVQVLWLCFL